MKVDRQKIKEPEVEAGELQAILVAVGDELRKAIVKRGKSGLTYAQFKEEFLKNNAKAKSPSHACR